MNRESGEAKAGEEPPQDPVAPEPIWRDGADRETTPRAAALIPERSLAGRALLIVIAIMTFLGALTAGAVDLIAGASSAWSQDVSRELTIQIRPESDRDIELDLRRAADAARKAPGVSDVIIYSKEEAERLLEPWLGRGLNLGELPIPRLIVVKIGPRGEVDLARLRSELAATVPRAEIDDHRLWLARLATMANALVGIGLVVLVLVLIATAIAVVFATRGVMVGNEEIIEVLHLVGAEDRFIVREVQRSFLHRGLKGGAIGAGAALIFFIGAGLISRTAVTTPGGDQIEALFGTFSLGLTGYVAILLIAGVVALLTAIVSRATVVRALAGEN